MSNLTDDNSYVFAVNDTYEIQTTDPVEGAGAGASFAGIGVTNEPHQTLANRTYYLWKRQNTNIANISALQAFVAEFTGQKVTSSGFGGAISGYLEIPYHDVATGAGVLIVQWGFVSFIGMTAGSVGNGTFRQNFPIPFPSAVIHQMTTLQTNFANTAVGGLDAASLSVEPVMPYNRASGEWYCDWNGGGTLVIANGSTRLGLTGFSWFAIGY